MNNNSYVQYRLSTNNYCKYEEIFMTDGYISRWYIGIRQYIESKFSQHHANRRVSGTISEHSFHLLKFNKYSYNNNTYNNIFHDKNFQYKKLSDLDCIDYMIKL